MCLLPLKADTTAETTCTDVEDVFDKSDGGPSMTGRERGFASHLIAEQSSPSAASFIKLCLCQTVRWNEDSVGQRKQTKQKIYPSSCKVMSHEHISTSYVTSTNTCTKLTCDSKVWM